MCGLQSEVAFRNTSLRKRDILLALYETRSPPLLNLSDRHCKQGNHIEPNSISAGTSSTIVNQHARVCCKHKGSCHHSFFLLANGAPRSAVPSQPYTLKTLDHALPLDGPLHTLVVSEHNLIAWKSRSQERYRHACRHHLRKGCVASLHCLFSFNISFTTYIEPGLRCSIKKLHNIKHYNEPAVENRPSFCENLTIYPQNRWKASMDLSISTHLHRRHHKFLTFATPQSFFSRFAQPDTHPNLFYPLRPAKL